jgi:hypothetical protein
VPDVPQFRTAEAARLLGVSDDTVLAVAVIKSTTVVVETPGGSS